jgi:predicted MFS family arabinose efflux permease
MTESKWDNARPAALALMLGLVAGRYISNFLGWQVASGTLARQRAAIVEQLASICNAQARTEVQDPSKLDRIARGDLAEKWAVMPGRTAADSDVTAACAGKLGGASH